MSATNWVHILQTRNIPHVNIICAQFQGGKLMFNKILV